MSDSDDDVPIFHRRPAAAAPPPASAPASAPTAVSARVAEAAVKPAQDAVQKPAAVKKEVESDSDDDVPIAQRSKPAGRNTSVTLMDPFGQFDLCVAGSTPVVSLQHRPSALSACRYQASRGS